MAGRRPSAVVRGIDAVTGLLEHRGVPYEIVEHTPPTRPWPKRERQRPIPRLRRTRSRCMIAIRRPARRRPRVRAPRCAARARRIGGEPPPATRHRGRIGARLSGFRGRRAAAIRDGAAARGSRCEAPSLSGSSAPAASTAGRGSRCSTCCASWSLAWPTSASSQRSASRPRSCRRSEPRSPMLPSLFVVVAVARCCLGRCGCFSGGSSTRPFPGRCRLPAPCWPALGEVTLLTAGRDRAWRGLRPTRWAKRDMAVLVAAGNAGNRSQRAPLAAALARQGLAVLLFDYRGYGGNRGRPTESGLARATVAPRCDSLQTRSGCRLTGCCTSARASARPW